MTPVVQAKNTKLGEAGGIWVDAYRVKAKVVSVDREKRTLVLVQDDGTQTEYVAGPEVVNFPQIQVGDTLTAKAIQQVTIKVVPEGMTAQEVAGGVAELPAVGEKPGLKAAFTSTRVGTVTAVDLKRHKATLRFEDGTVETVKVRDDVPLSSEGIGRQVVINLSVAMLIAVE